MAKNMQKPLVFVGQNKDACFYVMIALETDSGSILGRFWTPRSPQNRPKIDSERYPASCSFLNAIQDLQKSIFGPTWPQLDPREAAKRPPRAGPKRSENGSKTVRNRCWQRGRFRSRSWTDFGPIWDRFGTVLGSISERFSIGFWSIFKTMFSVIGNSVQRVLTKPRKQIHTVKHMVCFKNDIFTTSIEI